MDEEGLRDVTNGLRHKRVSSTRVQNAMSELHLFAHRYAETLCSIDKELDDLISSRKNMKRSKTADLPDVETSPAWPAPRLT